MERLRQQIAPWDDLRSYDQFTKSLANDPTCVGLPRGDKPPSDSHASSWADDACSDCSRLTSRLWSMR